jgi:hypothetical protein
MRAEFYYCSVSLPNFHIEKEKRAYYTSVELRLSVDSSKDVYGCGRPGRELDGSYAFFCSDLSGG